MDIREYIATVVVPGHEKDRTDVYSSLEGFQMCPSMCGTEFRFYHNCGNIGLYVMTIDRKKIYFFWDVILVKRDGSYELLCIRHGRMKHVEQRDGVTTRFGNILLGCKQSMIERLE